MTSPTVRSSADAPLSRRAVRGQLAVLETRYPAPGGAAQGDRVDYRPVTVAAVRRDGTPAAFTLPDARTITVGELTHPTVALLAAPGRYDPQAVLAAAHANGVGGRFASLGDVDKLFKRHPAPVPAPAPAAGKPAVLVLHRPAGRHSPAPWSVCVPWRVRVRLASACGTKARARTVAAWLEGTGVDFADEAATLALSDVLIEFYREWEACVRAALDGAAPWPDRTPERFAGLLAALAEGARGQGRAKTPIDA
ncbi:hypothetical protein ACGF12_30305 [Kitasatospora sp. NPDC048296]|uniref:hypothetical protein n=1 Tax=Kitasatospora sp. NPDC048296 TaxID=3364048 RepID=UPI003720D195